MAERIPPRVPNTWKSGAARNGQMLLRSPSSTFEIRDETDVDYDATLPPPAFAQPGPRASSELRSGDAP